MPTESFGVELRRLRAERGLSVTGLARQLHYDKGYLSRLERGERNPSTDLARRLDAALDGEGRLLRLLSAPPAAAIHQSDRGTSAAMPKPMVSRQPPSGLAEHPATAAHFTASLQLLRERGRFSPPALVLPILLHEAQTLRQLVDEARGAHREGLLSLTAHYYEYASWMAQESDNDLDALEFTATSAQIGTLARLPHLSSYAYVRQAEIALYQGQAARVVELASYAHRDPSATNRVRSLALQRAAQGHALAGERARCEEAMAMAAELHPAPGDTAGPFLLGSINTAHATDLIRGWCELDLGRPDEAVPALVNGLAEVPDDAVRARTLFGVRLALALAAAGDVPSACATVTALASAAEQVDSATVRCQLHQLSRVLNRWSRRQQVRHVQATIACLVG
ncbi:helix-turn-helix domain-containing protein [Micromonospora wenchangensis]|uniref:helix-turn-helix domain-containing protein n=1 Tax=Micromonospora wenchangensis TaxID=1185415 RepID=UPI003D704A2F